MRARKRKLKKSNRNSLKIITAVVLVLFGALTYQKILLSNQIEGYQEKLDGYKQDVKKLKQEAKEIEEQKEYVKSDAYVEEMAREKLGLVYENEVVFEVDSKK